MTIAKIPYEAAAGAEVDHTSSTAVNEGAGGQSGRRSIRQQTIRQFHLTIMPEETEEVTAIYDTHRRRWPVAVRDWAAYTITQEVFALSTTDGSYAYFPVTRKIMPATGSRYLHQRILIPDEDETVFALYVDASPINRTYWAFDDFGIAKVPLALLGGGSPDSHVVTGSGNYMIAACFMDDSLTQKVHVDGLVSLPDVRLREILEDEMIALMAQTDDSI